MVSLEHTLSITSNYIDEYNMKACLVGLTKYLEQRRLTMRMMTMIRNLMTAKHGDSDDGDDDGDDETGGD